MMSRMLSSLRYCFNRNVASPSETHLKGNIKASSVHSPGEDEKKCPQDDDDNYTIIRHPSPLFMVKSNAEWIKLENSRIKSRVVLVSQMGDLHPFRNGPVFDAETVFFIECDKNGVYYWLRNSTFPKAKSIYLSSHPCESTVLHRFPDSKIYLVDWYERYKRRWAENNDNVEIVTADYISKKIEESRQMKEKFSRDM